MNVVHQWYGGSLPVEPLRCHGSPGYFDGSLQLICIMGSVDSPLPLDSRAGQLSLLASQAH